MEQLLLPDLNGRGTRMQSEHYEHGERVDLGELQNQRAIEFAFAVKAHDYADFIHAVRSKDCEGVQFDICAEIPQNPVDDIRSRERISVLFPQNPRSSPRVLALRKSFPSKLLHLNGTPHGHPRSLCLFGQDFREVAYGLTAQCLLSRVFEWLSKAATGKSHLPDQPLEPFILAPLQVIFDPEELARDLGDRLLFLGRISDTLFKLGSISIAEHKERLPEPPCLIPIRIFDVEPWHSRLINEVPTTVEELNILLKKVGVDLIERLQGKTIEIYNKCEGKKNLWERIFAYNYLLVIRLPKTREANGTIEDVEELAFFVGDTIGELGQKIGVLKKQSKQWGRLIKPYSVSDLTKTKIDAVRPIHTLNRGLAIRLAGIQSESVSRITAIGAGAIGSQIILNLARQGIGKWLIIDEDHLLPHNHSRHALSGQYEGMPKADILSNEIRILLNEKEAATGEARDVLAIEPSSEDAKEYFQDVDHIFDFSVSPAVLRHLASIDHRAPVTCTFLLKNGRVLVVISEGLQKDVRLDYLDVQLAAAVTERPELESLYASAGDPAIRYSTACRDVTTVLAQDVVATQAGIASQFLSSNMANEFPSIVVWTLSPEDLTVSRAEVPTYRTHVVNTGKWEVRISQRAIDLMQQYREEKLPNETGGVILGAFDVLSKTVYVGSVLPSPSDSEEWPMSYIRGAKGLKKQVTGIAEQTGGNLHYVGEWHSHPDRCSREPSDDDIKAHAWLMEKMGEDGFPGVMLIQGDQGKPCVRCGQCG